MEHYLYRTAVRYRRPKNGRKPPQGWRYDSVVGAWVAIDSPGLPLLMMESPDPGRPRPQTKKCDVETGEDEKGR